MRNPTNALVAGLFAMLSPELRDDFDERAAIIELDAPAPRVLAECLALLALLNDHPAALVGVTVLDVELDGARHWLVTTDVSRARRTLADAGGREVAIGELAQAIEDSQGGVTLLRPLG